MVDEPKKMAKKLIVLTAAICILLLAAVYVSSNWNTNITSTPPEGATSDDNTIDDDTENATDDVPNSEETEPTPESTPIIDDSNNNGGPETTPTPDVPESTFSATTLAEALADNKNDHEDNQDYTWDSSSVIIVTLNGNSIDVDNGAGTQISGTTITITSAGTYRLSGTLNDGQIIVDTNDEEVVRLILNGVNIASATNPPICVENADKTVIFLAADTQNYLTDSLDNGENGALFSKDDLTIYGSGTLTVNGNANDAIHSNDGLLIKSGTVEVNSVDDGICGQDYLVIKGGDITVNSVGDGLKSDNILEEDSGYIYIEDGAVTVTSSQGDAVAAQTDLLIAGGTFTLTSGGGGNAIPNDNLSTKGLKAGVSIFVDNGIFVISSSDDAVHSNNLIVISGGAFDIATGDDAVHAEKSIKINNGKLDISKCFEGLESEIVTINNGHIEIYATDDAINLVDANSSSNGGFGGEPAPSANCYLYINGGFIYIDADGDGIDSNGYIEMNDGVLIIDGPTIAFNAAIDYGSGSFKMNGGTIVAAGSSFMAQGPSPISTQYSVIATFRSPQPPGKLVNIQTALGQEVLTFKPTKLYQSIVFSSPELTTGSYSLYIGGTHTGTLSYGVYEGGTYSGGTRYANFTISTIVTTVSSPNPFPPAP